MKQTNKKYSCASAYSRPVRSSITYSRPIINILSARAHGRRRRRLGASVRDPQPCGRYAVSLHDLFSPLKTFQGREALEATGLGCKMACFGWNTHPFFQGWLTSKPLSPQDSTSSPTQRCLFMCRARWSDLEKHLSTEKRGEF